MDTAIVVALISLIGTLAVAVLNSPVILALIAPATPTPTLTAPGKLVFSQDFEAGDANGFAFETGKWTVERIGSNRVLQGIPTELQVPAAIAYFGSNDFTDGVLEFKVNFQELDELYVDFRLGDDGTYVLYFNPLTNWLVWAINAPAGLDSINSQPYTFEKDTWYLVRVEVEGEQFAVSVNDNLILTVADSRLKHGQTRFTLGLATRVYLDDVKVWALDH
jgi:hypothetical protein